MVSFKHDRAHHQDKYHYNIFYLSLRSGADEKFEGKREEGKWREKGREREEIVLYR
jgi:hypothetical protein